MIGMTLSDFIVHHYKWEWVFYGFGIAATVWVIVWFLVTKESPSHDKWILSSEKKFILDNLSHYENSAHMKTPWCSILTSMPVYATGVAYFAYSWGITVIFHVIPQYMKNVLKSVPPDSGLINSLPCLFITILLFPAGYLADLLIMKNYLSISQVRKFFNNTSFFGQMVFMLMAGYFQNEVLVFTCICLSIGIASFAMPGFLANTLDIAPNYSSIILGFANSFSSLAELTAPLLEDYIIKSPVI